MASKDTEYFLRVISAEGLQTKKLPNTHVEIKLEYQKSRTKVVKKSSQPIWNEDFRLVARSPSSILSLKVMHKSALLSISSFLCGTEMEIGKVVQAFERNHESESHFPLHDEKGAVRGHIKIACSVRSSDVAADHAIMPTADPPTSTESGTTELVGYDVGEETVMSSAQTDILNALGPKSEANEPRNTAQSTLIMPALDPPTNIEDDTTAIVGYSVGEETAVLSPQTDVPNMLGPKSDTNETHDGVQDTVIYNDATPTAVLGPNKLPHRLIVDEALLDDNSVAIINPTTLTAFALYQGDTILVRGKKRRDIVLICLSLDDVEEGHVQMNKVARNNLHVKVGDSVYVYLHWVIKFCKYAHILPIDDSVEVLNKNLFDIYLKPYFRGAYRPVGMGDTYVLRDGTKTVEFKVVLTDPSGICLVTDDTIIDTVGDPVRRDDESLACVGYDDIGVCRKQLAQIRDYVELPLRHPKLFKSIGAKPPRGILLVGPSGSGQRLIARAIADQAGVFFFEIHGPDIMGQTADESKNNLAAIFQATKKHSPAVIFIDEIDSIAPRRAITNSETERRVTPQLITLMDGLKNRLDVVVMGATTSPNSIDPALRRFERFEWEIDIGIPTPLERLAIIRSSTKNMTLADDVDLEDIASKAHGFVSSDIILLCSEAAMQQIREKKDVIDSATHGDAMDPEQLDSFQITMENFRCALDTSVPSALREIAVQAPTEIWHDINICGLEEVRREIRESFQYPVSHPEKYIKYGVSPSKGILLYGPPGTGKSLLAKAIADDCNANFINIKALGLLKKTRGIPEVTVRDIFDKARAAAPCVMFFDDLDFIAKTGDNFSGDTRDRVLSQILVEMDCMYSRKNVFIIGATNRPDCIDPALLRPGRLGQMIHIPLPDKRSRVLILRSVLAKSPVAPDVDLYFLAGITSEFSGADLRLICQRAVRLAVRDSIDYDIQKARDGRDKETAADGHEKDPVPMITREHFKEAVKCSRRSVSEQDIRRCEMFARRNIRGNSSNFKFPESAATDVDDGLTYSDDDGDCVYG